MKLDDYLRRLRTGLRRLPAHERDAVVQEVRHHLQDEANDLMAQSPGLSRDDATAAAIDNFGSPEEVAAGYDEQTGEVRTGGEVALRVTKAVGRGAGKAAVGVGRVLGIALIVVVAGVFVVVVAALLFAGTAITVFDDEIREAVPRPVDHYDRTCETTSPCAGPERAASFDIGPDVKEFRILYDGSCTAGSARLQATDPSGDIIVLAENACENDGMKTFTEQGRWTIDVVYAAYVGDVEISVLAFERAD